MYIFYLHLQYQSIPAQIDLANSYIVFPSHIYGQYLDLDPATHNQNHAVPKSVLYNLAILTDGYYFDAFCKLSYNHLSSCQTCKSNFSCDNFSIIDSGKCDYDYC